MKNGGYIILDLADKGVVVGSTTPVVIPGAYEVLEGSRKAVLVSGINIGTTSGAITTYKEYHDAFVAPSVSGSNFVFSLYGYNFTVTDDDEITCAAPESNASDEDMSPLNEPEVDPEGEDVTT